MMASSALKMPADSRHVGENGTSSSPILTNRRRNDAIAQFEKKTD